MNEIININGVECYEKDGTAYLKLETVARGLGFTQEKNGVEYIKWERVQGYLKELGFSPQVGKNVFIPENVFYRLAMKAKNETAEKFQALIADEVIPSIRKTGGYMSDISHLIAETVQETIRELLPLLQGQSASKAEAIPKLPKRRRLKPPVSIIGTLDTELRQMVEDMLGSGKYTYMEISRLLRESYGIQVSKSSLARYASHLYMEGLEG